MRHSLYHADDTNIDTVNFQLANVKMDMAAEIQVEFTLGTAREFGVRFCTGDAEATVIGYETRVREIFLDRHRSGDISFSDKFDGVHRAPLVPEQGKINLHIFVDVCSVEVFANNGLIVISDLIFPRAQNIEIELYARDGDVHLNKVAVWKLVVEK
jgi:fructan beta-fructosidase